jgi:Zn-dependent protease
MPKRTNFQLARVFGIRIGVSASWFVVLFLLIYYLSEYFHTVLGGSQSTAYLVAVAGALGYFASLILHELGHALVARRLGIPIAGIDLWFFGGLSHMRREPETAGEEFKIAAAGPLATFGFVLVCLVVDLAIVGPHRLTHAAVLDGTVTITPVLLSLSWLLFWNVLLLIFNLVPAFPLDGGRIARAIVWKRTGDKTRGTRVAAKLGQGFAIILGGLGIFWMLETGSLAGLWLIALAFLIGSAARGALVQSALTERIEGVRVADIMDRQPVAIPGETAVGEAIDAYFLRYGWPWFPVVDRDGRFLGIARQERVQAAIDGGEGWLTVGAVLDAGDADAWGVSEDRPLTEVLASESLGALGAVMAVDRDGMLSGVVTIEQVRRALQSALGSPAS